MKTSSSKWVILISFLFIFSSSCQSQERKLDKARDNKQDAAQDLKDAEKDYDKELADYNVQQSKRAERFEQDIAKKRKEYAEAKSDFNTNKEKEIARLEKQNAELRDKLNNYKEQGKDDWKKFQEGFDREMNELDKALSEIVDGK